MDIEIRPMAASRLYRVIQYNDIEAGNIIQYIPVLDTGEPDPMRVEYFVAQTFLNGMPMNAPIEGAASLQAALEMFSEAVSAKIKELEGKALQARIMAGAGMAPSLAKNPPVSKKRVIT